MPYGGNGGFVVEFLVEHYSHFLTCVQFQMTGNHPCLGASISIFEYQLFNKLQLKLI